MADFEIKPTRLLIDTVNFQCKDDQSGCIIFNKAYLLGYRPFNNRTEVDWYSDIVMYKIIKTIKPSLYSRLKSVMTNWSSNTDKFVRGE
jgi:hypothetical protein